jgi:excisionase family DNA binding protein
LFFFDILQAMNKATKLKRMTVKQAAHELGVSVPRVHQLIQEQRLPAEKLGRDWIIESGDLEKVKNRPTGRPAKKEIDKE